MWHREEALYDMLPVYSVFFSLCDLKIGKNLDKLVVQGKNEGNHNIDYQNHIRTKRRQAQVLYAGYPYSNHKERKAMESNRTGDTMKITNSHESPKNKKCRVNMICFYYRACIAALRYALSVGNTLVAVLPDAMQTFPKWQTSSCAFSYPGRVDVRNLRGQVQFRSKIPFLTSLIFC